MRVRISILLAIVAVAAVGMAFQEPIPQDARYHAFADQRTVLRVPNFWNVASNVPFLLVGLLGLHALRKGRPYERQPVYPAWAILFLGIILVAFGSGYYHLAPDNPRLTCDRLPMTIAFMSLLAIVIGEWIDARLGRRALPPLLLLGVTSVLYWHLTEAQGRGDLRPYVLMQFLPLVIMPLILLLFPVTAVKRRYVFGALAAYVVAKALELTDASVFQALRVVSGHTLKHLVSAGGAFLLVIAVRRRSPSG